MSARTIVLSPPFRPDGGYCYLADLPSLDPAAGDGLKTPRRSFWALYEDGVALGPAHASHDAIRADGAGAYSHWGNQLYFSASGGGDPNSNGRQYQLREMVPPWISLLRLPARLLSGLGRVRRRRICRFTHVEGHMWRADIGTAMGEGDSADEPQASGLVLYERDLMLGPAHAPLAVIAKTGLGAYSHWHGQVMLSSSDNSDPNTNGRRYETWLDIDAQHAGRARRIVAVVQGWLEALPAGPAAIKGRTILEIGSGPDRGTLALLAALSAGRVIAMDRYLGTWRPDRHPRLMKAIGREAERVGLGIDRAVLARIARGGLEAAGIIALETGIESLPDRWRGEMDFIFSHAVLEHLEDPAKSFAQMATACRPGALSVHDVDFRDHRDFSRPLEFLLMDAADWVTANGGALYCSGNRLRLSDTVGLLRRAGFTILRETTSQTVDAAYFADLLPRLRRSGSVFSDYLEDDLVPISGTIVARL